MRTMFVITLGSHLKIPKDGGGATCQSVHFSFVRNSVVTASVGKIEKAIESSDFLSRLKVGELNKNRKSANFISTP